MTLEDSVQAVLERYEKHAGDKEKIFLAIEREDGTVERIGNEVRFPGQYAFVREAIEPSDTEGVSE